VDAKLLQADFNAPRSIFIPLTCITKVRAREWRQIVLRVLITHSAARGILAAQMFSAQTFFGGVARGSD
jgi:hypothetical protein